MDVPVPTFARRIAAARRSLTKLALSRGELDAASAEVDTDPTDGQKESGNYKKGHVRWKGLGIAIENPKGSVRRGKSKDGKAWSNEIKNAHYGYFKRTESDGDGDGIDVFLADDDLDSDDVFVINQIDPDTGKLDEHKVVVGVCDADRAKEVYLANYPKDWKGLSSIRTMTVDELKKWLKDGDTSKAAGECCPHCGARLERGDDGACNRCGKPWPEKRADLMPDVVLQPHQKEVQETGKKPEGTRMLLYHSLGSGKSLSAISGAEAAKSPYTVVAPAALRPNFEKEIAKFTDKTTPANVVSYNAVAKGTVEPTDTVILDEMHRARNQYSKTTQQTIDLTDKAKNLYMLSGSPIVNRPNELAPMIRMLTGVQYDPDQFDDHFVDERKISPGFFGWLQGIQPTTVPAIKNEEEFDKLLEGHVHYHAPDKPDVEQIEEHYESEMSPEQSDLYRGFWDKLPFLYRWKLQNSFPLSRQELVKFQAFVSGPRQVGLSTYPFMRGTGDALKAYDQSPKLQQAMGMMKDSLKDPNFRGEVYSNFIDAGLKPYAAALEREGVPYGIFHGGLNDAARKRVVEDYNNGKIKVVLIGPSGSEGISLKGTRVIQILDPHFNSARAMQAVGRGVRYDSHTHLPPDQRNVRVQRFVSRMPRTFWEKAWRTVFGTPKGPDDARKGTPGVDTYLEQMNERKDSLNQIFLDELKEIGSKKAAADLDADAETELIRKNRLKPENQKPHKFTPARWTHPNYHPRCIRCGDEESMDGICSGYTKEGAFDLPPHTIDRPKGFKKTFRTQAGPVEHTYPVDYGYLNDYVNPDDEEGLDVFLGSGKRYGRFMKGTDYTGTWQPDERKWYAGLNDDEYDNVVKFFTAQSPELLRDFVEFKGPDEFLSDIEPYAIKTGKPIRKVAAELPLEKSAMSRWRLAKNLLKILERGKVPIHSWETPLMRGEAIRRANGVLGRPAELPGAERFVARNMPAMQGAQPGILDGPPTTVYRGGWSSEPFRGTFRLADGSPYVHATPHLDAAVPYARQTGVGRLVHTYGTAKDQPYFEHQKLELGGAGRGYGEAMTAARSDAADLVAQRKARGLPGGSEAAEAAEAVTYARDRIYETPAVPGLNLHLGTQLVRDGREFGEALGPSAQRVAVPDTPQARSFLRTLTQPLGSPVREMPGRDMAHPAATAAGGSLVAGLAATAGKAWRRLRGKVASDLPMNKGAVDARPLAMAARPPAPRPTPSALTTSGMSQQAPFKAPTATEPFPYGRAIPAVQAIGRTMQTNPAGAQALGRYWHGGGAFSPRTMVTDFSNAAGYPKGDYHKPDPYANSALLTRFPVRPPEQATGNEGAMYRGDTGVAEIPQPGTAYSGPARNVANTRLHEYEHALQSKPQGPAPLMRWNARQPWQDPLPGHPEELASSAMELGPSLSGAVDVARAHQQTTGAPLQKPWYMTPPVAGRQPISHNLDWMVRQGREHGLYGGRSMTELLGTPSGQAYTKRLMEASTPLAKGGADAPGIPSRSDFGDLSKLEAGQLLDYIVQKHRADRAGLHHDVRLGNPEMGLHSWAVPKGPPPPGQKHLAIHQPVHSHEYGQFEGTIPEGYGKGDVKKVDEGQVLITKVSPDAIHFTTAHRRHPERFSLIRPKGWGSKDWLLVNSTPTEPIPYSKIRYKKIPAEHVEQALSKMKPGSTTEAKIDGASSLVQLARHNVDLLSYRTSKTTGRPIIHGERFFGKTPQVDIPKKYEGSILRGEMYGVNKDDEKAIHPAQLSTLLNSSVGRSLRSQQEQGVDLKTMLFDVQQFGGKPVDIHKTPFAERRKMLEEVHPHLPEGKFEISPGVHGPEEGLKLWKDIGAGKHPLTTEGIVVHPQTGKPWKAKYTEDHDVHVTGVFPGEGKRAKTVGGFTYGHEPGKTVGKVGTGFSDQFLDEVARDPSAWTGRVIRVKAQEKLPSGALRAPVFIAPHEDYPTKATIKEAADDNLLCTIDSSAPIMLVVRRTTTIIVPAGDHDDHDALDDAERGPFTVAIDLDGTLAEKEEPFDPESIGPPRSHARKWARKFKDAGARIIIFTVRDNDGLVSNWLNEHDIPFDYINENPDQPPDSSGKVWADVYWDDKAINAEDLEETGPQILELMDKEGVDGCFVHADRLLGTAETV